jgi:hypothetical protein
MPSRYPLSILEQSGVQGLLKLCSSPACPPTILPASGLDAGRPTNLPHFSSVTTSRTPPVTTSRTPPVALASTPSKPKEFGPQVSLPTGSEANPSLRVALARLARLASKKQLRGPAGQGAVLEVCRSKWRVLVEGGCALVMPTKHYVSGEVYQGGTRATVPAPIDTFPLF